MDKLISGIKSFKLSENSISMILGGVIVLLSAVLVFNYINRLRSGGILSQGVNESLKITGDDLGNNLDKDILAGNEGVYAVEPGEGLWQIAEKKLGSGFAWGEIAKANNLTNPDFLFTGQKLIIPSLEKPSSSLNGDGASHTKAAAGETYQVVSGDSLWDIALSAYGDGYRWVEIAKANNLANPDYIHAGNELNLP